MKITEGYQKKSIGHHSMVVRTGMQGEEPQILFALNETGTYLWEGIEQGKTFDALLEELMKEYEAGPEEKEMIARDILDFLDQLRMMGALEE